MPNRNHRRPDILTALALVLPLAGCGPETVTFTYVAPEGRRFVLEETLDEVTEMPPLGALETKFKGTSRVRVERESAWRVHWIETIESGELLAGRPTRRLDLGEMLGGSEVRTDFSDSGEAVAVHGLGALSSALLRHLQEAGLVDDPSAVAPVPSGDEHLSTWNERVHALAGVRLAKGGSVEATGRQEIAPRVDVGYRVRMTLGDGLACPGETNRQCVRLALEYSVIEEDVAALRGRRLDSFPGVATVVLDDIRLSGSGERVLDPSTLLVYSERREPMVSLSGKADGERFNVTVRQNHRWTLRPAA